MTTTLNFRGKIETGAISDGEVLAYDSATGLFRSIGLIQEATDILSLRRDTNAQTLRVHRTYTDANNYERLSFGSSANEGSFGVQTIAAETAGSGTDSIHLRLSGAGSGYVDSASRVRAVGLSGAVGDIGSSTYGLSVQNNSSDAWLEILNSGGAGNGAFFGMTSNEFQQYNWQGGPIIFFTHPSAQNGTPRYWITENGAHWFFSSFTSTSNYDRLAFNLAAASGYVEIAAETAGTGADNIDIRLSPAGTGNVSIPRTTDGGLKFVLGDGITGIFTQTNVLSRITFGNVDVQGGTTVYGGYFQAYGNNWSTAAQRGGVEVTFDNRNSGTLGFGVYEYNGSSWTQRFKVEVGGNLSLGTSAATRYILFDPNSAFGTTAEENFVLRRGISGSQRIAFRLPDSGFATVHTSTGYYAWGNGSTPSSDTVDLRLYRDAAATLALRNSTTAQTFRLYRTFTDSSNYERLALQTGSGFVQVAAETAGTGTDNIDLYLTAAGIGSVRVLYTQGDAAIAPFYVDCSGASIANGSVMRLTTPATGGRKAFQALKGADSTAWASFEFPDTGITAPGFSLGTGSASRDVGLFRTDVSVFSITDGTTGATPTGGALEFIEFASPAPAAPATNRVRLYADDDGAGNTRLLAVFATGKIVTLGTSN